jgi:hypothetical protein
MARTGRKRHELILREPNGRPKRPTVKQMEEQIRLRGDVEKLVVLMQPHRGGDSDQRRASALGRFVMDHKLRPELYDAGNEYAGLVRRLWAAKGVPSDQRGAAGSMGLGPSDATVRGWEKREEALRTALMRLSSQTFLNIRRITVEEREVKPEFNTEVIAGLMTLAVEMGRLRASEHPYA